MTLLLFVSLTWAFSFGLIKGELTSIEPSIVAAIRLLLSFICFVPFAVMAKKYQPNIKLMFIGGLQFGLMYLAYIKSYQYLPGYLVAVFTIFTPLYVMIIDSVLQRKFQLLLWLPITTSIIGTGVIVYQAPQSEAFMLGFVILQIANLAFAFGQVAYKRWATIKSSHTVNMASMYLGAFLVTAVVAFPAALSAPVDISVRQWGVLLYLGLIASGLCFYLWNKGAVQVNTPTLAIMNNGYVPFAVIFSLTLFDESANINKLIIGSILIVTSLLWAHHLTRKK